MFTGKKTRRNSSETSSHDRQQRKALRHGPPISENPFSQNSHRTLLHLTSRTSHGPARPGGAGYHFHRSLP